MKDFITQIKEAVINHEDLKELFRQMLEDAINQLLERELTAFLQYEKWDVEAKNTENKRNGYYHRELKTEFGVLNLRICRDRLGQFKQQTVPYRKRSSDNLETTIIQLYKRGITTREISDIIEQMYGHYYSAATVSQLGKMVDDDVKAFHNRRVKSKYVAIICDATSINVRRGTVAKEALHVLIGIDTNGYKEVLDYGLFPNESAGAYREILLNLKKRGLEEVLLFVSDGLVGLPEAVTDVFPQAKHQSCWTHIQRNVRRRVRTSDQAEATSDLKRVYNADNAQEAEQKLDEFIEKWGSKYSSLGRMFIRRDNLFSFMAFPESVRPSLYTNNIAESLNKNIKRITKVKEQFPQDDAVERCVCSYFLRFNARAEHRRVGGFKAAQYELEQMFKKQ